MILNEYGEYPAQYRPIIWKSLLKLPYNTIAYCKLLEKGPHDCVKFRKRHIHVFDPIVHKNLKRICSMLVHWSRILGISFYSEEHFLPYLVFPFVKFGSSNMLMCFEIIATILINQCYLWFEFSPMLPSNYLGLIQNLIDHFEPKLVQFYNQHSIRSSTYAWKLMRTAFSEVLDEFQWHILWDHIISAPSYFLVFVIVAFNCVQCKAIQRLNNATEIVAFFNEPVSIDMRIWLRKAYKFMEICPKELHPNQYMNDFNALNIDGQYQKILNYPNEQLTKRMKQQKQMKERFHSIHQRYMDIERMEMDLMQQMVNNAQIEEHRKRMFCVDLLDELALIDVAAQMENQRQHLIVSQRQLNNREAMMKMIQKENELQNKTANHEMNLQKNLCYLTRMVNVLVFIVKMTK